MKFKVGDLVVRKPGEEIKQWKDNDPRAITEVSGFGVEVEGVFLDKRLYSHSLRCLCLAEKQEDMFFDEPETPWGSQVGGTHYTKLGIQPLKRTLINLGYEAFKGACYTKIDKYTTRTKDDEVEQLKKARHVLDLWIHEAEKQKGLTND